MLFIYTVIVKISVNEKGVHPLDICLIRTLFMFVGCAVTIKICNQSCYVEKQDRWTLFWRSVLGLLGFTMITFALPMVPLLVQSTVVNTAPFWTSILGCMVNNEIITRFEIVAMILSFGGVICIALSGRQNEDDEQSADQDVASQETSGN